jgi:hypothetical protein
MNSSRATLYVVAFALLLAAAILLGQQHAPYNMDSLLAPCVMGGFGLVLFGFGWFMPPITVPPATCVNPAETEPDTASSDEAVA